MLLKDLFFLEILMLIRLRDSTELRLIYSIINKKKKVWKRSVTTLCLIERRD